jgi:hypothetical protein
MTVKYDAFFDWMKRKVKFPDDIRLRQDEYFGQVAGSNSTSVKKSLYLVGMRFKTMPYQGLELLAGQGLVVGADSPAEDNINGLYVGETLALNDLIGLNMVQVFEVEKGQALADNTPLALVARIRKENKMRYIEYCPAAANYGIK